MQKVVLTSRCDRGKSGLHHIIYQYIYAKKKLFLGTVPPHFFIHERMTALTRKGTPCYLYSVVVGGWRVRERKKIRYGYRDSIHTGVSTTICALLSHESYPVCTRDTIQKKKQKYRAKRQCGKKGGTVHKVYT